MFFFLIRLLLKNVEHLYDSVWLCGSGCIALECFGNIRYSISYDDVSSFISTRYRVTTSDLQLPRATTRLTPGNLFSTIFETKTWYKSRRNSDFNFLRPIQNQELGPKGSKKNNQMQSLRRRAYAPCCNVYTFLTTDVILPLLAGFLICTLQNGESMMHME